MIIVVDWCGRSGSITTEEDSLLWNTSTVIILLVWFWRVTLREWLFPLSSFCYCPLGYIMPLLLIFLEISIWTKVTNPFLTRIRNIRLSLSVLLALAATSNIIPLIFFTKSIVKFTWSERVLCQGFVLLLLTMLLLLLVETNSLFILTIILMLIVYWNIVYPVIRIFPIRFLISAVSIIVIFLKIVIVRSSPFLFIINFRWLD